MQSAKNITVVALIGAVFILAAVAWVWRDSDTNQSETSQTQTVRLYYYNPSRDIGREGGIACSRAGLVSVRRELPMTSTPIEDTLRLLLRGELTPEERASGITTEFPLSGVTFEKSELVNGVLTLTFSDPNFKTGGGSCRVGILWAQIETTARQFAEVNEVRFSPEELFQP